MRRCDEWSGMPSEVFLPHNNTFIPTKFDLKAPLIGVKNPSNGGEPESDAARKERERAPDLVRETAEWRFYFKQDRTFGQPRAFFTALIASSVATADVDALISTKLWRLTLLDCLAGDVYDALLSGLGFDIDVTARGLRLTCFGYDEKLGEFVALLAQAMTSFDIENPYGEGGTASEFETPQAMFERQRELLRRELEAFDTQQPYQFCKYWEASLCERPHYSREELRAALERATLPRVASLARSFWSGAMGKALLQGNMNSDNAAEIFTMIEKKFARSDGPTQDARDEMVSRWARLPKKEYALVPTVAEVMDAGYVTPPAAPSLSFYPTISHFAYDAQNANSAVEFVWQFPETQEPYFSKRNSTSRLSASLFPKLPSTAGGLAATAEVYAALLEEPVFEQLRTQQQLGYIVFSGLRNVDGVRSFVVIVQSASYGAPVLHDRVADFIAGLLREDYRGSSTLGSLNDKDVQRVIAGLIEKKLVREKRLLQQVGRHWEEIISGTFKWDRASAEVAALRTVDLDAVLAFHNAFVSPSAPCRRVIAYHISARAGDSKPAPSANIALIRDTDTFKKFLPSLPVCDVEVLGGY